MPTRKPDHSTKGSIDKIQGTLEQLIKLAVDNGDYGQASKYARIANLVVDIDSKTTTTNPYNYVPQPTRNKGTRQEQLLSELEQHIGLAIKRTMKEQLTIDTLYSLCLLYTSPSPRDRQKSRMPSSA